jgi:hypothetical protein
MEHVRNNAKFWWRSSCFEDRGDMRIVLIWEMGIADESTWFWIVGGGLWLWCFWCI